MKFRTTLLSYFIITLGVFLGTQAALFVTLNTSVFSRWFRGVSALYVPPLYYRLLGEVQGFETSGVLTIQYSDSDNHITHKMSFLVVPTTEVWETINFYNNDIRIGSDAGRKDKLASYGELQKGQEVAVIYSYTGLTEENTPIASVILIPTTTSIFSYEHEKK